MGDFTKLFKLQFKQVPHILAGILFLLMGLFIALYVNEKKDAYLGLLITCAVIGSVSFLMGFVNLDTDYSKVDD